MIVVGIDPGIDHFAWTVVEDLPGRLPALREHGKARLDLVAAGSAARAARELVRNIIATLGTQAVGVESFEHRPRFVDGGRRIATGPQMGEIVAAVELTCDTLGVPVLRVPARDHKNQVPAGVYPHELRCQHAGDCRHQHLRDAYSVACWTLAISTSRTLR